MAQTATLTEIWTHPIKGIGREALASAPLSENAPLPGDRAWALLHDGARDTDDWQPRGNFLQVASGPNLAAIACETLGGDRFRLTHPDRPALTVTLPDDQAALINWIAPLWPADRAAPHRVVRAPAIGMADNGHATLSILNRASLADLSRHVATDLEPGRFRGNVVIDGLEPWVEESWLNRTLRIGDAELHVLMPIERCRATEANTATGKRDANTLAALRDHRGNQDMGVYARVSTPGCIRTGDRVEVV
ncbi:MOSC domain-containing protein [Maribius pontilimi]|uniref:MOSC domain-containing protein n=1 Tax=Palleronia pontilimi TaxID=1964209 RepID=A0A934ILX8_9RHOB|nr:MOSC domain-containing protein [Palleronia pontilimi]MBJ3764459.1 MOSC domain-containing protein [Palleronia pontilimi]